MNRHALFPLVPAAVSGFRFSLRTLLTVTAMCGLFLAAWKASEARVLVTSISVYLAAASLLVLQPAVILTRLWWVICGLMIVSLAGVVVGVMLAAA